MLNRRLLRIKVVKALYAHFKSESESITTSEKALIHAIEKTYQLYHQLFMVILDVQQYAENRIETGRQKMRPTPEDLNPNMRFVNNKAVKQIYDCKPLMHFCEVNGLGWVNYPDLIKSIYNDMIKSNYYKRYMEATEESFSADKKFVVDFFEYLESNEMMEDVLLDQSIFWEDDLNFALIMVVKTIGMAKADKELKMMPMYKNQDDFNYVKQLYRSAIANNEEYSKYIESATKNWELERIAFMDNIIMLTALAEIDTFPSIPVKVSFDEFIEISKFYSTPTSSGFINGVLDKILISMRNDGKAVKEGRGLI